MAANEVRDRTTLRDPGTPSGELTTEEELRRSRQYLAEAQRVSHTGSWAWSPVSNEILYWSEECFRILDFDPARGLPPFDVSFARIHPDDQAALLETIERSVREERDFETDYRVSDSRGAYRNVRILAHPARDRSGKVIEYIGTVADVTEQKRAEEERRNHLWILESMDRINRAMQRTNEIERMIDGVLEETLAIFGCERACLVYPCDPGTPTWRVMAERTTPQYAGAVALNVDFAASSEGAEMFRRLLQEPGPLVDPKIRPDRRAQYNIASMLAMAVRPREDRPYMFAMHQCSGPRAWSAGERRLFEEIARRLEDALTNLIAHRNLLAREKELRRAQHYLAEGQKLSHTASWAWSPLSNTILYWSQECYRIYGCDPAQGLPTFESLVERIHPEDRTATVESFGKAVRENADFQSEHRVVLPGGVVRHLRILANPAPDASGESIEYLGTVIDITEQKRAEEERKEHLWFLECMDRINRAMQRTNDVERMMSDVVEEILAIFGSDRAWLVYPCDPDAATCRAVMEHTRPEYPGAFALGEDLPVDGPAAEILRRVLAGPGVVTDLSPSPELCERFSIRSTAAIAVRPKGDQPYLLGLHQCSKPRRWTSAEARLLEEIARRLEDALTSVLAHRNLLAREEDLRRSRAYLAEAQKVSHTGSWAWDNVGRRSLYWSEECYRIYGRDPSMGLPLLEDIMKDIHPDDRPRIAEALENALSAGAEWEGEYRLINFPGEPRVIRTIAHPVADRSGQVREYIGTVVDVTDQKRAEEELRANEERFRTFVDQASDAFILYDENAFVHDVNQRTCESLGYTREELIGMHVSQFAADATPERIESLSRHLLERGTVTYNSLRRRKDGSIFPAEVHARVFYRGDRPFSVALATDITERQRREQCLLAQHGVTKSLSEATSIEDAGPRVLCAIGEALDCDFGVLWCVDEPAGVLRRSQTWSPASAARPRFEAAIRAATFGPGEELPGLAWSSGAPQYVRDIAAEGSPHAVLAAGEGLSGAFAFPVLLKSSISGVLEFFTRDVRDASPELLQMMTAVGAQAGQFVERTRAEEALRTARAELAHVTRVMSMGELTASIAHEVNQPLGAMVTSAASASRWLAANPPNLEKARLALGRIAADGERASAVIDRMRMLVKRQGPGRAPIDVNETIASVVVLMRDELERAGVAHAVRLAENLPTVLGDPVLLQQVIVNLILNAIDAMRPIEGRARLLRIESRLDEGGQVRVEVRDTGTGLPPDARLFEAFYTTKERGLGMGLSISRSIVEEHGGRMRAGPDTPHGAVFEFSLPVTPP